MTAKLRQRELEQLMLALTNQNARRVAFAPMTPSLHGSDVGLELARVSAGAGTRTAYLSFANTVAEDDTSLTSWSGTGVVHQADHGSGMEGSVLTELAWRPAGGDAGLSTSPARLKTVFDRDFGGYELLVCNLPPMFGASQDAPNPFSIAKACDGLVLVVAAIADNLDTVAAVVDAAKLSGVKLLGTVLEESVVTGQSWSPFRAYWSKRSQSTTALANLK